MIWVLEPETCDCRIKKVAEGSLVDPRLRAAFSPAQPRARRDALLSQASTFPFYIPFKLARFFLKEVADGPPLRAFNEGLLRPRVA